MADFLWQLVAIFDYMSIFITWLFVISFLYNLSTSINNRNKNLLLLSFIMMLSYTSSMFIDPTTETPHLKMFMFDIVTIVLLVIWGYFIKGKIIPVAFYYLIVGLSFNALMFLGMHYDVSMQDNTDYWWFWALYAIGQVVSDCVMAIVLIINKDVLKILWLGKKFKGRFILGV
ncbi:hypothetical protein PUND_a3055 [Pseudoalteromonas undina]|uniref:Membrane protein n=1 Tax=Pseudoalteromonas undina TaxID=43660 RepID=A0ABN0NJL1_9GAMM|nr:hypothetical protein [Pseudoalteromonas undina]KAF7767130.1 hypothetical protein PUND_a3055 [Pseudoalteromonas undina]